MDSPPGISESLTAYTCLGRSADAGILLALRGPAKHMTPSMIWLETI